MGSGGCARASVRMSSTNTLEGIAHSVPYLALRTCVWLSLASVQGWHVLKTETFGSCPRALAVGLSIGSVLFTVRDLLTTIFYAIGGSAMLPLLQFADCLSEAYFLVGLLISLTLACRPCVCSIALIHALFFQSICSPACTAILLQVALCVLISRFLMGKNPVRCFQN